MNSTYNLADSKGAPW